MATIVKSVDLEDGGQVFIEVQDRAVGPGPRRANLTPEVGKSFEKAWKSAMPVARAIGESIAAVGANEAQVTFGITLTSDLDAFVASVSAEANFEVTLTWTR